MADVITLDVNEKPAIDGFENLIDEIVKVDKATDKLEDSGNRAVSTINRIRPAAAQSSAALGQIGEKVSQLGVQFSTGSEKVAGFVPNLLRLGPAGSAAVATVGGLAAGLTILNNTGLRDGKSNLDRLGKSAGDLAGQFLPAIDVVKTADKTISGISDTIVENTDVLAENIRKWALWVKGVRDTKETDDFFERTQSGFAKLREEEKRLSSETDKRKKSEEIANIKTIDEVSNRLRWLREEQSQIIRNTVSEKERDEKLQESFQKRAALESRLAELEKAGAAERAANAKFWADRRIAEEQRVATSFAQQREFESKAFQESIDFQKRVAKDWADYQRGLQADRRSGILDTAEAVIRAKAEEEKALAERMQGEARDAAVRKSNSDLDDNLHTLRIKRIKEEMNQRLQATKVSEVEDEIRRHNQTEGDAKLNSETMRAFKQRQVELQQQLKEAQQEGARIVLDGDRSLAIEEQAFKRQQAVRAIEERKEAEKRQIDIAKASKDAELSISEINRKFVESKQEEEYKKRREMADVYYKWMTAENGHTAKEVFEFNREMYLRGLDDKRAADKRQIEMEREKRAVLVELAKAKGLDARASEGAFNILQNQDPRKVRQELIDRARRDAGPDKKDQADAARQAARDFAKGNVDPTKMAQAELDAANKTVGAMVAGGKLDNAMAQALGNQLRIAAQLKADTDRVQKQVDELQKVQDALINASNPNRNRAGAGGQKG